jgi:hypothetical protein
VSLLHHHLALHLAIPAAVLRPSTLYLQFNNCSWENKNKYMLAYCHWLVFNKVFQSPSIFILYTSNSEGCLSHLSAESTFHLLLLGLLRRWLLIVRVAWSCSLSFS